MNPADVFEDWAWGDVVDLPDPAFKPGAEQAIGDRTELRMIQYSWRFDYDDDSFKFPASTLNAMTGQPADQMSPFRPAQVSVTKQALFEATCAGICTWTYHSHLDTPLVLPNPWNKNSKDRLWTASGY